MSNLVLHALEGEGLFLEEQQVLHFPLHHAHLGFREGGSDGGLHCPHALDRRSLHFLQARFRPRRAVCLHGDGHEALVRLGLAAGAPGEVHIDRAPIDALHGLCFAQQQLLHCLKLAVHRGIGLQQHLMLEDRFRYQTAPSRHWVSGATRMSYIMIAVLSRIMKILYQR